MSQYRASSDQHAVNTAVRDDVALPAPRATDQVAGLAAVAIRVELDGRTVVGQEAAANTQPQRVALNLVAVAVRELNAEVRVPADEIAGRGGRAADLVAHRGAIIDACDVAEHRVAIRRAANDVAADGGRRIAAEVGAVTIAGGRCRG